MNRREALQALMALPAVKSIEVADVKPNDVIIVECDCLLSLNQKMWIRDQMERVWPERKILILEKDLRLRIARERS